MMNRDSSLEDQLRDWAEDTASAVPRWSTTQLPAGMPRRGRRVLALATSIAVLAGAGAWYLAFRSGKTVDVTASAPAQTTGSTAARVDRPAEPRLLTCGGEPYFLSSALAAPAALFDLTDPVVAAALDNQPSPELLRGRVLVRNDDAVMVAIDVEESEPGFAPFEVWYARRLGDTWQWQGGGGCPIRAVAGGLRADKWELDPAAPPLGPDATEIPIWVWEGSCASGQTAEGRVREPVVDYTDEAVVVMIAVEPIGGACPSNPPTPFVLRLSEPLGNRRLLDGGSEPPAPPEPNPGR